MPFLHGSLSFSRFRVVGGSPKRLDDNLLDKFRGHVIGKGKARSDGEEVGWLGGRHLLDREFDTDKNVILDCLHFGLRVDTSKVPPDLMRAYIEQEREALLKAHDGWKPARIRKEAIETAKQRAAGEMKDGRFRSMRQFPILWDTRSDVIYLGATQPAVQERFMSLFRDTFDKRVERLSAGRLAYDWAEVAGNARRIETAQLAKYVPHERGNGHIEVYWTAADPASRDYLGNEFLLWLWWTVAEQSDVIHLPDETDASVLIVKQLTLECPWAETGKQVLTADGPASLPESRRALQGGKLPRKVGLVLHRDGSQYELALQAETFNVSGGVLPKLEKPSGEPVRGDLREQAEERVEQVRHFSATLDALYHAYLAQRFSDDWARVQREIAAWVLGVESADAIRGRMADAGVAAG